MGAYVSQRVRNLLLASLVLLTALPGVAAAQFIELEGRVWVPEISARAKIEGGSSAGTTIDFDRDLGIDTEPLPELRLSIFTGPNSRLRLAYTHARWEGNSAIGQAVQFTVLAYPDRIYPANVSYVATALDATSRRLLVRATVNNSERLLKPEMFASVTILTGEGDRALAVRRTAVIYEGDVARVWVARSDKAIELRRIKPGLTSGNMVQVLEGLGDGDRVVTKGSLFIDRLAAGS